MPEEAPVTSSVPLVEVVMSVLRFASRWLEPVGRTVTYALPRQQPIGRNWNPPFRAAERTRDGSPRSHVDRAGGRRGGPPLPPGPAPPTPARGGPPPEHTSTRALAPPPP